MAAAMGISAKTTTTKQITNPNAGLADMVMTHVPAYDKVVYYFNHSGRAPRKRRYNNHADDRGKNYVPAGTIAV